ncbi:hypothetical protein ACIQXF_02865 [Lysinibacillus sp. NPDC097231]|uniref:hypothetical protein n=1 Tax=Lysinibacillus sp. NPDC097231 TaxID=3364142 RepID=UPI003815AE34
MKTNDIVINKIIDWLETEDKSYEWLAEQLGVSKALVGFMLKGDCTLKSERIEQFARIMRITTKENFLKLLKIVCYMTLKKQVIC